MEQNQKRQTWTDSAPVKELARQLGKGAIPDWVIYQGKSVIDLPVDLLLQTDQAFQMFWVGRLEDEVRSFQRILAEADFLDQPVQDFFGVPPLHRALVPDSRLVREWAESRLASVQQELRSLIS